MFAVASLGFVSGQMFAFLARRRLPSSSMISAAGWVNTACSRATAPIPEAPGEV